MTSAVEREAALPLLLPTQHLQSFPRLALPHPSAGSSYTLFSETALVVLPPPPPAFVPDRTVSGSRSLLPPTSAVGPHTTTGEPARLADRERPGQDQGPDANLSPQPPQSFRIVNLRFRAHWGSIVNDLSLVCKLELEDSY